MEAISGDDIFGHPPEPAPTNLRTRVKVSNRKLLDFMRRQAILYYKYVLDSFSSIHWKIFKCTLQT
ncbi:hypothetical protein YC2023_099147 [Brassica napus]